MFKDVLDSTRLIKILREIGKTYECAVYWKDRPETAPLYGGKIQLSKKLFGKKTDKVPSTIGFIPVEG